MKNLLAIAVVMFLGAYIAQAADFCTASATGKFKFTVEQAIGITGDNPDRDLGSICPGCEKDFSDRPYCANWTVTGGKTCYFQADLDYTPSPALQGVTVTQGWQVQIGTGAWVLPTSPFQYPIDPTVKFRACISKIAASCEAAEASYTLTYKLSVKYICSMQGS